MTSRVTEGIEALERVTDERQTEVGVVGLARGLGRGAHLRGSIDLRDLVDREVLRVDGAGKLGLEGSADLAKTLPVDSAEEGVFLQLGGAAHVSEAVLWVTDEAVFLLVFENINGMRLVKLTLERSAQPRESAVGHEGT